MKHHLCLSDARAGGQADRESTHTPWLLAGPDLTIFYTFSSLSALSIFWQLPPAAQLA